MFLIPLLGLLIQVVGHLSYLGDIFRDPLYSLFIVTIGYLGVSSFCLEQLIRRKMIEGRILEPNGGSNIVKIPRYGKKQRGIALIVLVVATGIFLLHVGNRLFADNSTRKLKDPLSIIEQYEEHRGIFSMLEIFKVYWTGGGASAVVESGRRYPLASIFDVEERYPGVFTGAACALIFEAEVPTRLPWVRVDGMVVKVNGFTALPKYTAMFPLPYQAAHVYYVEMDNPAISRKNEFKAEYYYGDNGKEKFGSILLEAGKPESFVIRINANTPGIYNFDVFLRELHAH